MSETHIHDLRQALERNHWTVADEIEGNEYDISGVWSVARPDGTSLMHIEFEGLTEDGCVPMNQAHACRLREEPSLSVYFGRVSRSWPKALTDFMEQIDNWAHNDLGRA